MQHYKVLKRFGGQIQAVHFSGILNAEDVLPRKRVDFYRSPGFQETKALCVPESDLNNSAPTTSCVKCYWDYHRGTH